MHSFPTLPGFNLDTTSGGADMSLTLTSNSQFTKFLAAFAGMAESWALRNCNYYKGQDLSSNYVIKPASEGKKLRIDSAVSAQNALEVSHHTAGMTLQLWQLCCRSGSLGDERTAIEAFSDMLWIVNSFGINLTHGSAGVLRFMFWMLEFHSCWSSGGVPQRWWISHIPDIVPLLENVKSWVLQSSYSLRSGMTASVHLLHTAHVLQGRWDTKQCSHFCCVTLWSMRFD